MVGRYHVFAMTRSNHPHSASGGRSAVSLLQKQELKGTEL